ncbi:DUF2779 domain-containing protein [Candidatus Dojkabacteria bacterium]|nr:DUF2779 domain-containing protein [Candidatus Dojkabacteria bacterium]
MLTKSEFLIFLDSPKHLWARKNNRTTRSSSPFFKFLGRQGYHVEELAREFAKEHLLQKYVQKPNSNVEKNLVFQETITRNDLSARSDILIYDDLSQSYDIYEVKSSTHVKSDYIWDTAFQYFLFSQKFNIRNVYLIYVNSRYKRGTKFDLKKFFRVTNLTDDIKQLQDDLQFYISKAKQAIKLKSHNSLEGCLNPKTCPCKGICHPNLPDYSIYDLWRLNTIEKERLRDKGIINIIDIPQDFKLSIKQKRQIEAVKNNKPFIDEKSIIKELKKFELPLYFLDYETFGPAIPMYEGYKPFQHMCFQYSVHKQETESSELEHFEFITTKKEEPSKYLVEDLSQVIGKKGTVIVWYERFEKTRNTDMAKFNPKYASFLENLNERIFDLMNIFKNQYYIDANFKGSSSIKSVLPVLVPEFNYSELNISEGAEAMVAWYDLVYKDLKMNQKIQLKEDLLEYCKLDTLAMYEIWKFLNNLVEVNYKMAI